jgi:hypothetical protein
MHSKSLLSPAQFSPVYFTLFAVRHQQKSQALERSHANRVHEVIARAPAITSYGPSRTILVHAEAEIDQPEHEKGWEPIEF